YRPIWRSNPIPNDPITVRSTLSAAFQSALKKALFAMTPAQLKLVDTELGVGSGPLIPAKDKLYKTIRAIVKLEHLDITAIGRGAGGRCPGARGEKPLPVQDGAGGHKPGAGRRGAQQALGGRPAGSEGGRSRRLARRADRPPRGERERQVHAAPLL